MRERRADEGKKRESAPGAGGGARVGFAAQLGRAAALSAALGACSPASDEGPAPAVSASPAPVGREPADAIAGLVDETESSFVPVAAEDACVVERADLVAFKEPVDIIVIVDNSASMEEELAATERNINESFAAILEDSGLDYRMIALTLHRRVPRTGFGQSATMLCVERPLSSVPDCATAPEPRFSDRFFQYSTRIESDDSFDVLLDTYAPPFALESREEEFGNAPNGWSEWLRPGIQKVFLELSDGNENMPAAEFVRALSELDPVAFGADPAAPGFVFHSIIDIAEKASPEQPYLPDEPVESDTCGNVPISQVTAGEVYQELSRLTGGLRFPICQADSYDVVFREIAGRVVDQSAIACDFPLPEPPPGRTLDLDQVSISIEHTGTGAAPTTLGQARLPADCQSDAFFIEGGRIALCPEVCSAVRAEEGARVDVLFGCESTIIVR